MSASKQARGGGTVVIVNITLYAEIRRVMASELICISRMEFQNLMTDGKSFSLAPGHRC